MDLIQLMVSKILQFGHKIPSTHGRICILDLVNPLLDFMGSGGFAILDTAVKMRYMRRKMGIVKIMGMFPIPILGYVPPCMWIFPRRILSLMQGRSLGIRMGGRS